MAPKKAASAPAPAAKAPAKPAPKQPEKAVAKPAAAKPAPAPKAAPKPAAKAAKKAKPQHKTERPAAKKALCIIYGLDFYGFSRQTVRKYFSRRCGAIRQISIRKRWGHRGAIKILFHTEEAAKKCKAFDGVKIRGNNLKIFLQPARPRIAKSKLCKTVFVAGLPSGVTQSAIRRHFGGVGRISKVRIYKQNNSVFGAFHPQNKHRPANSGRRGLQAYVYFSNATAARRALKRAARPFQLSPRSPLNKLFVTPSYRTIEQDKRRAEWANLVAKVFNPRLQEREKQPAKAKANKKADKPVKGKEAPKAAAPAKEATKTAAPVATKAAPATKAPAAKPAPKAAAKAAKKK